MFAVNGLVTLVTGGASGLGLAYVEVMAENGARVTMLDRDRERLDAECGRLRRAGHDVAGAAVDVTDQPLLDEAFDEVVRRCGRLDVVFANAGVDSGPGFVSGDRSQRLPQGSIAELDPAVWNKVIGVNLTSVFLTIRAAARHMKKQNSGRIIVTTSVTAFRNEASVGIPYMPAKAGAAHLMRQAALELARYNVLVNAIAPGPFVTNLAGPLMKDPAVQESIGRGIPLRRVAKTEEIKGLALFLASPASSYVTGAQMVIDGGYQLGVAD
jgi:NAD(P)-dependent dehydrogenase (short-subunit alcohol dehydrogenase family)